MKLLVLTSEFPPGPGGIGSHSYHVSSHLFRRGHSITVLVEQRHRSDIEVMQFNRTSPFPIIRHDNKGNSIARGFKRLIATYNAYRSQEWDAILATGAKSIWCSMILRLFCNVPVVVVVHGSELTAKSLIRRTVTHLGCKVASHVIAVSAYSSRFIPQSISRSKISIIHNGADGGRFVMLNDKTRLKRQYEYVDRRVILTVGAVSKRKGQDIVLRAMKDVVKAVPDALYLVLGRYDSLDDYQRIVDENGLRDHVQFLGMKSDEDLLVYYNMADVFVLTSRHTAIGDFEGFGIVVIEAAFCGVPSIVSLNSGLIEAITEGETGVAVSENNIEETAQAIIRLLTDENLRVQMGSKARLKAIANHSWQTVAIRYEKVLEAVT